MIEFLIGFALGFVCGAFLLLYVLIKFYAFMKGIIKSFFK